MKKTIKLFEPEHYEFSDGATLDREEVTVEQFGITSDGRTVWADVDDNGCLYTFEVGKLWKYVGEVF